MGCYRHYDEATGLYTVSFFGVMTAKDFYVEREPIYADLEQYRPGKFLLDYSMAHPKINPFDLERFGKTERGLSLIEETWTALVVNTALKRGMTNLFLTAIGAKDHIQAFSSLVDAKLWLSSKPDRAAAVVGDRKLRFFGVVLLVTILAGSVPQWYHWHHRHHSTTRPARTAVARAISPASTKS